jgi:hypothetical protein
MTTSWQVWDNGTVERFKPTIITGVAQSIALTKAKLLFTGMANIVWDAGGKTMNDDFIIGNHGGRIITGLNTIYNNQLALRLGRNSLGSVTAGVGLSWGNMSLDYAFLNEPSGSGLGTSHLISISVNSDWVKGYIEKL